MFKRLRQVKKIKQEKFSRGVGTKQSILPEEEADIERGKLRLADGVTPVDLAKRKIEVDLMRDDAIEMVNKLKALKKEGKITSKSDLLKWESMRQHYQQKSVDLKAEKTDLNSVIYNMRNPTPKPGSKSISPTLGREAEKLLDDHDRTRTRNRRTTEKEARDNVKRHGLVKEDYTGSGAPLVPTAEKLTRFGKSTGYPARRESKSDDEILLDQPSGFGTAAETQKAITAADNKRRIISGKKGLKGIDKSKKEGRKEVKGIHEEFVKDFSERKIGKKKVKLTAEQREKEKATLESSAYVTSERDLGKIIEGIQKKKELVVEKALKDRRVKEAKMQVLEKLPSQPRPVIINKSDPRDGPYATRANDEIVFVSGNIPKSGSLDVGKRIGGGVGASTTIKTSKDLRKIPTDFKYVEEEK